MDVVVDTHALILFLHDSPSLGKSARNVLEDDGSTIFIPTIVLAEAFWILDSRRVPLARSDLSNALASDNRVVIVDLTQNIVEEAFTLSKVSEMHDRLIVATAKAMGDVRKIDHLITKDKNIIESGYVSTLWD